MTLTRLRRLASVTDAVDARTAALALRAHRPMGTQD
jgi:hypothetical protein